jgi:serine/threonine-protein kinase
MGEVWRATDTKLEREVAIKILPANFAQDPERMTRFERGSRGVGFFESSEYRSDPRH